MNNKMPLVTTIALLVALPAVVLLLAACGGDDDGQSGTVTGTASGSPIAGTSTATDAAVTVTVTGQATPPPTGSPGETVTPAGGSTGTGSAMIGGVTYSFTVAGCAVEPNNVVVLGGGYAPDGRPFIATASWYRQDYLGNENAIEVGIGTNAVTLFDLPEKVYKMGTAIAQSEVGSLEIDVTGFSLTMSGKYVDLNASQDPATEGSFNVSCIGT